MKKPDQELHTLVGAYAMDAISAPDRARFERHLAGCQECAQEIASLREATARLATATAVPPPPGLKERVLTAAAQTRQHAPEVSEAGFLASRARPRWLPRRLTIAAAAAAAAVVVAAAVVFGVSNGSISGQLSQDRATSQQVAAVLTARDATMISAPVTTGGTATIVMSAHDRALVFAAAGLRALPPSSCYELWLMRHGRDQPAAMLPTPRHGMTGPVLASGLKPGDHLGLTIEPVGGSPHPTTPAILQIAL